jgi:hypothetical protein
VTAAALLAAASAALIWHIERIGYGKCAVKILLFFHGP